jgi:hypothetical protein
MANSRIRRRAVAPLILAGGALVGVLSASPAWAGVTGGCQGVGTIEGTRYDAAVLDPSDPITIPESGDVGYEGSVPLSTGDTPRAYSGSISLDLPLGASITVADWSGSSEKVAADPGTHHYSIPSIVPRGVTVHGSGSHQHEGLSDPCKGSFAIKLAGGPLDSPVPTATAAVGTIGFAALLFRAARPKGI